MEQLEFGVKAEVVVEKLLAEHPVKTTKERVQAYRYYREQRGFVGLPVRRAGLIFSTIDTSRRQYTRIR